jgi:predicted DNA-binding protein (UPF0251 family)
MLIIKIKDMARPEKKRRTRCSPASYYYKPRGIPIGKLDEIQLKADEFEAIKLADLDGLFQEEAAAKMNVSRATFGRIISRAHKKIADAVINGKSIKISENLPKSLKNKSKHTCKNCGKISSQRLLNNRCNKCLTNIKE